MRPNGPLTPNLILIRGGEMRANTSYAVDMGDGLGNVIDGVDFEHNGTAGNLSTGAVVIRSSVDDSIGIAVETLRNCWFEQNHGQAFKCEAGVINLTLDQCIFISNESEINIGAIYNSHLINCFAGTTGAIVAVSSAGTSIITVGQYYTVNDTSTRIIHEGFFDFTGLFYRNLTNAAAGWDGDKVEFFGAAPLTKPTITGSRSGNAALANLLTQLAALGLVNDSTSP